jgi:hypothetical protein
MYMNDSNLLFFVTCCFTIIVLVWSMRKIFNKGLDIGIRKGLGKPIEDLEELKEVLNGKDIFILFFISERDCGIFLAETKPNDITGEGIVYCKIEKWKAMGEISSINPKPGKHYNFSIVDGTVLFSRIL